MTPNARGRIRRLLMTAPVAGLVMTVGALPAAASGPTCSDVEFLGIEVHGQHVVRDYVTGGEVSEWPPSGSGVGAAVAGQGAAIPGGPGPGFHFPDIAPGASFCNSQSYSPGFHVSD